MYIVLHVCNKAIAALRYWQTITETATVECEEFDFFFIKMDVVNNASCSIFEKLKLQNLF